HEQALRFTADARSPEVIRTSGVFQRAIAYYRGHGLDGKCDGREIRGAVQLVRLSDGVWFAPEWRRSLVRRR
ncbi:hypothetical protein HY633_01460, partial [Candidatus Uhrbacteria bacterium]|nr:hypothetical protein [Candidatus Uhrbacteria bacterium]